MHENYRDKTYLLLTAAGAFLLSFLIQLFFNRLVLVPRSLPDEMGAVYLASRLAGNDWSYVMTHPAMYYGSLMAPLMYPFFKLVHDPLILYQCLLGVGAFLRSLASVICFHISYKYLKITSLPVLFFLSIACCFFTPTRATNIDNEPGLILCCWVTVLLIMALANAAGKRRTLCLSVLLAMVLCVSLLSHTRAVIYTVAAVAVIFFFHVLTGKAMVNYRGFGGIFCIFFVLSKLVVSYWQKNLYPVNESTMVSNTSGSFHTSVKNGLEALLGEYGIQSFFDLLAGNILVTFVFSGGLVIVCFLLFFILLFRSCKERIILRKYTQNSSLLFPLMFCVAGSGISILGLCVTWIGAALNQHINAANLSRGHFYLRYYAMFFGPLLMLAAGYWIHKKIRFKNITIIFLLSILAAETCMVYSYYSFIGPVTKQYKGNSDWFYYFAPFSMGFERWPDAVQSAGYYVAAVKSAVIIAVLLYFLYAYRKSLCMILCILAASLYQYGYSVIFWDQPFSYSERYYQSVNALCEFRESYSDIVEGIDHIYYLNQTYGPQYIVQFVLTETPVISETPPLTEDNVIIISNSIDYALDSGIIPQEYWYITLDDNEHLLVKGDSYLELFAQERIRLQPLNEY